MLKKQFEYIKKKIFKRINALVNENDVDLSVDEQKIFIHSLGEPVDDIERSYFQYLCQRVNMNRLLKISIDILSLILVLWLSIFARHKVNLFKNVDAVFFCDGKPDKIIPAELKKKYKSWEVINKKNRNFTFNDLSYFVLICKRYPLEGFFLLKVLLKIQFYSYVLGCYNPKTVVVCAEYSFTSSILTDFCYRRNVKHINVMHGEKCFTIHDSFFRFHTMYVWENAYIDLFNSLKASCNEFIIAIPPSLKFKTDGYKILYDYTYFLGDETILDLESIRKLLQRFVSSGYRVSVRPHPRYSDEKLVRKLFYNFDVQDTNAISIEDSIGETDKIITRFSTVALQAYYSNKTAVIDDVTSPTLFNSLKEKGFVFLNKDLELLSNEIEKMEV